VWIHDGLRRGNVLSRTLPGNVSDKVAVLSVPKQGHALLGVMLIPIDEPLLVVVGGVFIDERKPTPGNHFKAFTSGFRNGTVELGLGHGADSFESRQGQNKISRLGPVPGRLRT
jgi:hypothetical protein